MNIRKRVGEVFLDHKDRFLRYGEYCANLPKAQQMLEHMCNKNEVPKHFIIHYY